MPKINRNISLIFLLISTLCLSQTGAAQQPLQEQLKVLEQRFNITFNYAPATIEGILMDDIPLTVQTVENLVTHLNKQTSLQFKRLENTIIYINKKPQNTICGHLVDAETQQPIMGATILETNANYAISDQTGFFEITLNNTNKNNVISITSMGYEQWKNSFDVLDKSTCKTIALFPSTEMLDPITLQDFLVKGITHSADGNMEIDFDTFEILPGLIENDVLHSVQALPGIMSVDETISNINIHGGSHDQNLITWDGIKMYQSGHFFGLISAFNPQITKATIVDNGSNASFTDGVSGTILMETDTTVNNKLKVDATATLLNNELFTDIPISEKSSLQFAARKSISEWIKTPIYKTYFSRISQETEVEQTNHPLPTLEQEFDFYDSAIRYLYMPDNGDILRVNFILVNNKLKFTEQAFINNTLNLRESSVLQSNIGGSIFYKHFWNSNFSSDIEIYETDYTLKANNANIEESQRFLQKNSVSETGAKLTTYFTLSPNILWENGYNFTETEVTNLDDVDRPLFRELISKVVRTHALFSQVDYYTPSENTSLKIGVRGTYNDKFGSFKIEPRLSISHHISENINILAQGEFKHQNTSQIINFQNDFLGIEKRRWQLADDDEIPVMEGKQVTLGANFNKNNLLLSLKGYYKYVDGITTQSQGFSTKYEFTTTPGSYQVNGIDILLRKKIKGFTGWLSYAFMDNTYTFPALIENTFNSNFDITHALTLGTVYTSNRLNIAAGFNWRTGKPTTLPVQENVEDNGNVNFKAVNSNRLQDYFRTDISALYQLKKNGKWRAEIGFSILNLLNQENTVDTYYRIIDNELAQFNERSLEISTNAILKISI